MSAIKTMESKMSVVNVVLVHLLVYLANTRAWSELYSFKRKSFPKTSTDVSYSSLPTSLFRPHSVKLRENTKGQFHQSSTSRVWASRSQKHKKGWQLDCLFWAFGICTQKKFFFNIDEIDTRRQTSGVNFTLPSPFLYKGVLRSFSLVTVLLRNFFWRKNIGA
jgi:hypothetical protein